MGIDVKNIAENFKKKTLLDTFGVTKRALSDKPQRAYMWDVQITNGGIVPVLGTILDNVSLFAKSITVPSQTIEPIQLNIMGERIFYSGKDSSPRTVEMIFWDDEAGSVRRYLDQWYQMVHENKTGKSFSKDGYERTIDIKTKDTTDTAFTSVTKLTGCFPIEIGPVQLSYDNSDIIEISATFQYDNKEFKT